MRIIWILRHAFAIAVLPATMTIFIPMWVMRRNASAFRLPEAPIDWLCAIAGVVFFVVGIVLFVATLFLFASRGRGTLAPWDPPARLVVAGPYRYVRNPMIAGVILMIMSEALILRSLALAEWAALFLLINAIYFPLLEEPQLEARFGDEYRRYKRHVRRFIPRLRPWNPV
jgi:protein-S-isoprenylcysteine O-methyltransferase Ste14